MNPKKQLLVSFIINFLIFYGMQIFFDGDEKTFWGRLFYGIWMATWMSIVWNWKYIKSLFNKNQKEEGRPV